MDKMPDTKASRYNTNLAAEFWVLATCYRLGIEAHLTLGNKKSVDVLIMQNSETTCTADVKGLAGPYDWPADNLRVFDRPNHYYVFLSFEGRILDPSSTPSVWIIPSDQVTTFIKRFRTRSVVSRALVKNGAGRFKDGWWQLQSQ